MNVNEKVMRIENIFTIRCAFAALTWENIWKFSSRYCEAWGVTSRRYFAPPPSGESLLKNSFFSALSRPFFRNLWTCFRRFPTQARTIVRNRIRTYS